MVKKYTFDERDYLVEKEGEFLDFPLEVYVDDNFRENFLKGNHNQEVHTIMADPDVLMKDDVSDLSPEDMLKLKKMLEDVEVKKCLLRILLIGQLEARNEKNL